MNLTFEQKVEVPATASVRAENPYDPLVKHLADNRGEARKQNLPADFKDEDIATLKRQIQESGRFHGVSMRVKIEGTGNKRTITVWARDAIKRPRKNEDDAPAVAEKVGE